MEKLDVVIIGAGDRGKDIYGKYALGPDSPIKVVGVVDTDEGKRREMQSQHNLSAERVYATADDFFASPRFCDAVINATPDRDHYAIAREALGQRYNLLLEKPMSANPAECVDIVNRQGEAGTVLTIAHVLRYAPFFQEIKRVLDSKELGELVHIDLTEHVGYWHFAHSYVRGNWRNEQNSGPVILTKSCHDLDMLVWLAESQAASVSSHGRLQLFTLKNKPTGAADKCLDCTVTDCSYDARAFYLAEQDPANVVWPVSVISLDKSMEGRTAALRTGPYGECVFNDQNDVCDTQTAQILFQNGVTANFYLAGITDKHTRQIQVYCTNGKIEGHAVNAGFEIVTYGGGAVKKYEIVTYGGGVLKGNHAARDSRRAWAGGSEEDHGGGDNRLVDAFAAAVLRGDRSTNLTSAEASLQSHLLAFAAEQSRKKGGQLVDVLDFRRQIERGIREGTNP